MKDNIKIAFLVMFSLVMFIAFIYAMTFAFAPLNFINREINRESITRSTQYRTTQRQALVALQTAHEEASASGRKKFLLGQMCETASSLPSSEIPDYIKPTIRSCR